MNPVDLQELVDRELKRLPGPRAPRSLLPRVLAATVEQPELPWYRSAWVTWPLAWQAVSIAAVALIAAGAWFAVPLVAQLLSSSSWTSVSAVPERMVTVGRTASETATVVRLFWRVLIEPVAVYLFALALSLSLACALIWTALERLALGGAQQQ
jgi:hypothetical protein